jgi:cell division protein FtsQ
MNSMISKFKWQPLLLKMTGFVILGLVILAMDIRKERPVSEIKTMILPLPDSSFLIEEEDVLVELDRGLGYQIIGQSFKTIDLGRIESLLEKNPFVKDAEVYIDGRNELGIKIVQRKPIVRVISNRGEQYYLDEEGNKLPLSKHFAINIVTATGDYPSFSPEFLTGENSLHDLFDLCTELEKEHFLKSMIVQVHVNLKKEFTLVPMIGDQKIIFGEFDDSMKKWKKLKVFYKEAMPFVGWRKYRNLDLRFRNQIVCN